MTGRRWWTLCSFVAVLLFSGCSSSSSSGPLQFYSSDAVLEGKDPNFVATMAVIEARSAMTNRYRPYIRVEELLPSVIFEYPGGREAISDAAIIGDVIEGTEGPWFANLEVTTPESDIAQVDPDDPSADWKTIHLVTNVVRDLGGTLSEGRSITIGLAVPSQVDSEQVIAAFSSAGALLFFLDEDSPVFAYDGSVYGTVEDGALIGTIDESGRVSFPGAAPDLAEALSLGNVRLTDLENAAGSTRVVSLIEDDTGMLVREDE